MPRRSRFNRGLPSLDPRPHDQRCEESLTHNRALNGASPPHLLQVFGWPARCRHRNLIGNASRSRTWTQACAAARMTERTDTSINLNHGRLRRRSMLEAIHRGTCRHHEKIPNLHTPRDAVPAPVRPTSSTTTGSGRTCKGACPGPIDYQLAIQGTDTERHTYRPCDATGPG